MICDDEKDLLHVYAVALRQKFNIITADSGKTCLRSYMDNKLKGKKIHILLLDYRLGDSTGDDIACKIRDLDGTKVIMLSAFELEHEIIQDLKKNNCIVELLKKPIALKQLIDKVERIAASVV